MINRTAAPIVNSEAKQLDSEIRRALEDSAKLVLELFDLTGIDFSKISTNRNLQVVFAKFVFMRTLGVGAPFNASYIEAVWNLYSTPTSEVVAEQFYACTLAGASAGFDFRRTYVRAYRRGLGYFLLALHCRGIITLPLCFDWPITAGNPGVLYSRLGVFSELVGFVRSLERNSEALPHPAFNSVGMNRKRREWFLSYGGRLLLGTGWLKPEDAALEDLLQLREAAEALGFTEEISATKSLVVVLRARYGAAFAITPDDWEKYKSSPEGLAQRRDKQSGIRFERLGTEAGGVDDAELLNEVCLAMPSMASPAVLRARVHLPGIAAELATFFGCWLDLQEAYRRVVKRESYKTVDQSIGYLNLYLFLYLPYWFQRHANTTLIFPSEPAKLISTVYIARLLPIQGAMPATFVEFLNHTQKFRGWVNDFVYAILKQVEGFFEFVEGHSRHLPGCAGFRQPIPDYAYPPVSRPSGTNKRPIPRRIFSLFLDYVEALRAHLNVVLELGIGGRIDMDELERSIARTGGVIDTFATSNLVGFIPVLFVRGKTVPLRYIPNILSLDWFPVGARTVKIPQPHALNQIVVALCTGIRHNHIQWLDARTFDKDVTTDDRDFAKLFVNTDKRRNKPWSANVNICVINVLRAQKAWRSLISADGFEKLCYYNNNPSTKWPPILPLFSSFMDGRPHPDMRYTTAWQDIVCAVDGLLPSLGIADLVQLSILAPPGVSFDDASAKSKREEYGGQCDRVCELGVKSLISPHSSRVTVVSQYSTFLPAELIGSLITGQTPGVVYYYVRIEDEQLKDVQAHQAIALREKAYRNEFENILHGNNGKGSHVRADDVNSNFSRSLRKNLNETLVSYGCISITVNDDATSGLDVLRETRAANAAENKTEVCPYGNHCPPEIVKQWRGPRRCGLCQYAVRSVDHLQAVAAKVKEFEENLGALTARIESALQTIPPRFTEEELDRLDEERVRIAEELAGWKLNEEVLDKTRRRIAMGQESRRWIVQKPEVILLDLQRVEAPSNSTAYLIARLGECISYPTCESPIVRARFDMFRRELLARSGGSRKPFDTAISSDPAAECAGLLRSVVAANGLDFQQVVDLLEGDSHLTGLQLGRPRLLIEADNGEA